MLNTITEMTTKPCMLTHQGFFIVWESYNGATDKH